MKILNIDAVTPPAARGIAIAGVNYPIPEVTVEGFLLSVKKAQELKSRAESGKELPEQSVEDQIEEAVKFICTVIPTLPVEVCRQLPMPSLNVIIAFLNGVIDETGAPTKPAAEGSDDQK